MRQLNNFIRGEHFPHVCDMRVGRILYPTRETIDIKESSPELYTAIPEKKHVSIYARTENRHEAMRIIADNPDKKFTLVTHNSDMAIYPQPIPNNLNRWFAQNRYWSHPRVFSLPIGLENKHWFPYKTNVMLNVPVCKNKTLKAFIQCNPNTHPERKSLMESVGNDVAETYQGSNGSQDAHELFVNNLAKYAFCICPRGNGVDTHRLWEALYMGCIPIVKNYLAHEFRYGDLEEMNQHKLPIVTVEEWSQITPDFLRDQYDKIHKSSFISNLLSMQYWAERINNEV